MVVPTQSTWLSSQKRKKKLLPPTNTEANADVGEKPKLTRLLAAIERAQANLRKKAL